MLSDDLWLQGPRRIWPWWAQREWCQNHKVSSLLWQLEAATCSHHAFSPGARACCLMAPLLMASRCVLGALEGDFLEDTPPPARAPPL